MMKFFSAYLVAAILLCAGVGNARAAETGEEFDPVHHVSDGFYLDFEPFGKVELPRIFLVRTQEGRMRLDAFLTSRSALASGRYKMGELHTEAPSEPAATTSREAEHGNPIQHTEEMIEGAMYLETGLVPVDAELLVDFSITRHYVFALLGASIVFIIFTTLARRYKKGIGRTSAPRGVFQNMFEALVIFVRDGIARPTIGEKYERYIPYLLTAFTFILTCNLMGLVPFGATATSNLMVTAVLAVFTFITVQFSGSKDYWRHIFWPPGVPAFVKPILIPVEFLGIFTKPFALAIRLFANMTAGHLVILSLIGLIFSFANIFGPGLGYGVAPVSVAFALFIYLLELLVAFIQAFIFTMLSGLFIGMATAEHHQEHEDVSLHGGHAHH